MKTNAYLCNLETLREIGFAHWDPIGLVKTRRQHEDEYDSYLLQAAGLAIRGEREDGVSDYLLSCCDEMGVAGNIAAAVKTAHAIIREVFGAKLKAC